MRAKAIVREIVGGFVMAEVLFATLIFLLWCSGHTTYAAERWTEIGEHRLTFYCHCARCNGRANQPTASGVMPTRYQTIAVNKKEIPLGTKVYIDGFGYRIAEDTGVPAGCIDIFIPDHQLCLWYGVKYRNVWIVEGENE